MIFAYSLYRSGGRRPPRIFSPSRGKTGIRLKMAILTLPRSTYSKIRVINEEGIKLSKILIMTASIRFDAGPARAISMESRLGFLKL